MSKRRKTHPAAGPILIFLGVGMILKSPILLLLMLCMMVFFVGFTLVKGALPAKGTKTVILESRVGNPKRKVKVPIPQVVNIPGVGEVEWITDIRQLEHQQTWNRQQVRQAEKELLDTDPREWRKEGEKVADSEEEALNKPVGQGWIDYESKASTPTPAKKTRPTHNILCHCQDCDRDKTVHGHKAAFVPECHQCFILQSKLRAEMGPHLEPAMIQNALNKVMQPGYSRGGIIKPDPNSSGWRNRDLQLKDHMKRRWG